MFRHMNVRATTWPASSTVASVRHTNLGGSQVDSLRSSDDKLGSSDSSGFSEGASAADAAGAQTWRQRERGARRSEGEESRAASPLCERSLAATRIALSPLLVV